MVGAPMEEGETMMREMIEGDDKDSGGTSMTYRPYGGGETS